MKLFVRSSLISHSLLAAICLMLFLTTACQPGDVQKQLPYILEAEYLYKDDKVNYGRFDDVSGDSDPEILFQIQYPLGQQAILIHQVEPFRTIDQINLLSSGDFLAYTDHKSGTRRIAAIQVIDYAVFLDIFTLTGQRLHSIPVLMLSDNNDNGQWDGGLYLNDVITDMETGAQTIILSVTATYDHTPRGLYAVDVTSKELVWNFSVGTLLQGLYTSVLDVDGDGNSEILCFGGGSSNGVSSNGLDDSHSYVFMVDSSGRLINKLELGGPFTWVNRGSVVDIDNDGDLEQLVFTRDTQPGALYPSSAGIIDLKTLRIEKRRFFNSTLTFEIRPVDLNNDAEPEIFFVDEDNNVGLFVNAGLETVKEWQFPGEVARAMPRDYDGDGSVEYLIALSDDRLLYFDEHQKLLAETDLALRPSKSEYSILPMSDSRDYITLLFRHPIKLRLKARSPVNALNQTLLGWILLSLLAVVFGVLFVRERLQRKNMVIASSGSQENGRELLVINSRGQLLQATDSGKLDSTNRLYVATGRPQVTIGSDLIVIADPETSRQEGITLNGEEAVFVSDMLSTSPASRQLDTSARQLQHLRRAARLLLTPHAGVSEVREELQAVEQSWQEQYGCRIDLHEDDKVELKVPVQPPALRGLFESICLLLEGGEKETRLEVHLARRRQLDADALSVRGNAICTFASASGIIDSDSMRKSSRYTAVHLLARRFGGDTSLEILKKGNLVVTLRLPLV